MISLIFTPSVFLPLIIRLMCSNLINMIIMEITHDITPVDWQSPVGAMLSCSCLISFSCRIFSRAWGICGPMPTSSPCHDWTPIKHKSRSEKRRSSYVKPIMHWGSQALAPLWCLLPEGAGLSVVDWQIGASQKPLEGRGHSESQLQQDRDHV